MVRSLPSARRRPLALVAALAVFAGALTGFAPSARADASALSLFHLRLLRSSPAADTTLAAAPRDVRLWFSQDAELATTRVQVTGPGSAAVKVGKLARGAAKGDASIIAPLDETLAAGRYEVAWRTMSKDGHVVKGEFAFTVAPARTVGQ